MQSEIISAERNVIFTREKYSDKWLWFTGYPSLSLAMLFIANDNSLIELLHIPSFYTDFLFSVTASFLAGFYIKKVTLRLDASVPWHRDLKKRSWLQGLYSVLLPLVVIIALEIIYLSLINIPFEKTAVFYLELPLCFLFLLLINLFYLVHYLFFSEHTHTIKVAEKANDITREFVIVQVGFVQKPLPIADCSILISKSKMVWLYTFSGEKYFVAGTMDEWGQKLEGFQFFRLNRQALASKKVVEAVEQTATRKLLIRLPHYINAQIFVSKERAAEFQKWWRQTSLL
ncbi:MAG: LytTR family transcriptional regulator DNA-binding domain-containing protein [Rhizobacter sp.]|nr:LytTR family transcriptional regulator DNA-binding domain-containing protein [Ferruginibacter sp.]